jgi:Glycosyltransferase family 87
MAAGPSASLGGLTAAIRQVGGVVVWGLLPLVLIVMGPLDSGGLGVHYAGDFHYAFWPAAHRVLHGASPYVNPGAPEITRAIAFVYPAVGALLLAPWALIPQGPADAIFAALNVVAVMLTLWILGVRDWRLYGAVLLCLPVYSGWLIANVTLLLGLGIAAAWRYRDRPLISGVLIALIVSTKLFLWPLGLWLVASRRYAAAAYAVAAGVVLNAAAWAVLGFDEIDRYRRLLRALTAAEENVGYSVIGLALRAGAGHGVAYALAFAAASGCAIACVILGRRGRDVSALTLAIAVSLLATPIVEIHYFALLIVPLAVARPRLSLAWAPLLAMWLCTHARPWQVAVALTLTAVIVAVTLRRPLVRPRASRSPQRGTGIA